MRTANLAGLFIRNGVFTRIEKRNIKPPDQ
jgi:hypothetical protein